jgi:hypothetical protein
MPPPLLLLAAVIALTAVAAVIDFIRRRRMHGVLRQLAVERHLHYSPHDQLRLTARVADNFPVPGAAHVRVVNLLYGSEGGQYRYVFTTEYSTGAVRSKKRHNCAVTFREPRERQQRRNKIELRMANPDLSLIEQYRELLQ